MAQHTILFQDIAHILHQHGSISAEDATSLVQSFKGKSLGDFEVFLLDEGIVTKQQLLDALSEHYEVPSFDVQGFFFNHDLIKLFPMHKLLKHAFIPIESDEEILAVVVADPHDTIVEDVVHQYGPYAVEFRVGILRHIIDEIREFADASDAEIQFDDNQPEDSLTIFEPDQEESFDISDEEGL